MEHTTYSQYAITVLFCQDSLTIIKNILYFFHLRFALIWLKSFSLLIKIDRYEVVWTKNCENFEPETFCWEWNMRIL
jgi:hypothetical protein